MVTTDSSQTISGIKTFSNGFNITTTTSWEDNDRSIPFSYNNTPDRIRWYNRDENKGFTYNPATGAVKAGSFVKRGGTATQFLKADGSVDTKSYLPTTGGTITGELKVTQIRGTGTDNNYIIGNDNSNATGIPSGCWFVGNYQKAGYIRSTGDLMHYSNGKGTYNILDSGNYSNYALPLSGGVMSGTITLSCGGSTAYNKSALRFIESATDTEQVRIGTDDKSILGIYSIGDYIALRPNFNFSTPDTSCGLRIYKDYLTIGTKKVWSEANDGSGSGLDADLLDGKLPTDLNVGSSNKLTSISKTTIAAEDTTYDYGLELWRVSAANAGNLPFKDNANAIIDIHRAGVGTRYSSQLGFTSSGFFYRSFSGADQSITNPWHEVAFIDSNVASADKLTIHHIVNTDLDTITDEGFYYAYTSEKNINVPSIIGSNSFNLQVYKRNIYITQILTFTNPTGNKPAMLIRTKHGSGWTTWKRMLTEDDLSDINTRLTALENQIKTLTT